jgi:hypothetical protein
MPCSVWRRAGQRHTRVHDGLALAKGKPAGKRRTYLGHLDVGPRCKDDAIEAENAIKEIVGRDAV